MSLEDLTRGHFTPEQQVLLGDESFTTAMDNALNAYSLLTPRVFQSDLAVSQNTAELPPEFEVGFSEVTDVLYPITAEPTVTVPEGQDGQALSFVIADWQPSADRWYLELTHGLESVNVSVYLREGTTPVEVDSIEHLTTNKIRLWVPDADFRFAGTAILERA